MCHALRHERRVRIHYQLEGSGPPLVLHPGFSQSLLEWYDAGYVDALKRDYRIIILDPRGQGESDKPHSTEAYGERQRVADVVAVLDDVGVERAHFWGYSMGGGIGFYLAKWAPERFSSLALGGYHPFARPPNVAWSDLLRQGMEVWLAELERGMGPTSAKTRELRLACDAEALAAATLMPRPSLEDDLGAMELPALVYCGDQDPAYERAKRAAELMPNATFLSLPGLNHRQAGEHSELVLPHVRAFLQSMSEAPVTRA